MIFQHDGLFQQEPAASLIHRHRSAPCPRSITFAGITLEVWPGVFAPDLTQTSRLMAACLDREPPLPGQRVLDLFTGTGLFALYAAKYGARVVAVDKEEAAARCARHNVDQQDLQSLVEVRLGSAPECLTPGERFDLVLACPPLLPGVPETALEAALVDPGLHATLSVLNDLPRRLAPQGRALIMTSDVFERLGHDIGVIAGRLGLAVRLLEQRELPYETYSVHEYQHG